MKIKYLSLGLLGFFALVIICKCFAQGPYPEDIQFWTMAPGVTNMAASSTNTLKGTAYPITRSVDGVLLAFSGTGTAATTNGSFKVFYEVSPDDGVSFSEAQFSLIKLTATTLGATNYTFSDWFQLTGVTQLRIGRIENNFVGPVSNLVFKIAQPIPPNLNTH